MLSYLGDHSRSPMIFQRQQRVACMTQLLQLCACHSKSLMDVCVSCFFNYSMTISCSVQGKSSSLHAFPLVSKAYDPWRLLLPVKMKAKKTLSTSGFSVSSFNSCGCRNFSTLPFTFLICPSFSQYSGIFAFAGMVVWEGQGGWSCMDVYRWFILCQSSHHCRARFWVEEKAEWKW